MNQSPAPTPTVNTRQAILDAAEKLFAEVGMEAASIRQITAAAGVNLAAVNYHFHSKDHLALEVVGRGLQSLNDERIALLDAVEAEAAAKGEVAPLEKVLEAFIRPSVEDKASGERREEAFICLMSRCFQEPKPEIQAFVSQQFSEIIRRFDTAILRAVPGLKPEELFWRMSFFVGSLHHSLSVWARFDTHPAPKLRDVPPRRLDREGYIRRLVAFAAEGFRAPAVSDC